ncbi:MAG: hypothetical protein AAGD34_00355 [Pseudomonadota bacterium]
MKYDDASWHFEGDFPEDSPAEYGATHIGLFLKWCLLRGWAGEELLEGFADEIEAVKAGTMTGTDFLLRCCDGKLTEIDLNDEGNAFAQAYYADQDLYLVDYQDQFGDLVYVAPESAHDFKAFSEMLDKRLASGIAPGLPGTAPD